MSKYYQYTTNYFISDDDIVITSTIGTNTVSTTVLRDGSMDANFKAACAAHRDTVLSLAPTSTSPPCYVDVIGEWIKMTNSGTVVSPASTIRVPAGNSGILIFSLEATSYVTKYSLNGGGFTTFIDGATVAVADGDTLVIEALAVAEQDFVNGKVVDSDTGIDLDAFSLMNNTPAP
jgi:hypothetical protein